MSNIIAAIVAKLPQEIRAFFMANPTIQKDRHNPKYTFVVSNYTWPIPLSEAAKLLRDMSPLFGDYKIVPNIREREGGGHNTYFRLPLEVEEVWKLCWQCAYTPEGWLAPISDLLHPEVSLKASWDTPNGRHEEWVLNLLRVDTGEEFIIYGGYTPEGGSRKFWAHTDNGQKLNLSPFAIEGIAALIANAKKRHRRVYLSEDGEELVIKFILADLSNAKRIGLITEADEEKYKKKREEGSSQAA